MSTTDPLLGDQQLKFDGRPPSWLGLVLVTSGVVALGCLLIDGRLRLVGLADLVDAYVEGYTIYSLDQVVLGVTVLVAGLVLLVSRSVRWGIALTTVAGMCAAQLAGVGLVGYRKWPAFVGGVASVGDWGVVRNLAAVMAVSSAIAAVACLLFVLRRGKPQRRALVVALPIGLFIAVAVPVLVPWEGADLRDRATMALIYGIPFGSAVALTGRMAFRSACGVTAAVIASAVLMSLSEGFIPPESRAPAMGLVVASALINWAWRLPDH